MLVDVVPFLQDSVSPLLFFLPCLPLIVRLHAVVQGAVPLWRGIQLPDLFEVLGTPALVFLDLHPQP